MLLSSTLFIYFFIISLGRCQFVYNYEEADTGNYDEGSEKVVSHQNDQQFLKEREPENIQNSPKEYQRVGTQQRSGRRETPSLDYEQEPQVSRNVEVQRPKKRKYRRVLREGSYVQPPQPQIVYSPSVFENVRLGEAPNGVYIPQDSFLNVLNNPQFNRDLASSQYQTPQNAPNSRSSEPEYKFYVQPPSWGNTTPRQNTALSAIQPSVQYASGSPTITSSVSYESEDIPSRRSAQTNRRRQRQRLRVDALPEPEVDIDALRTHADVIPEDVQPAPQARQVNQPRSVSRNSRRRTTIQNDQESNQPPKVYSPSVFQNIGLGEAPNGVHIPEDSLLNRLRNPSGPYIPPRNVARDLQPAPEVPSVSDREQRNNYQPEFLEQPESFYSRRHSRQRSQSTRASGRNLERKVEYPSDSEDQELLKPRPVSSQEQSRRPTSSNNLNTNRRQRTSPPQPRPPSRRQQEHSKPKHSEASSSRRQQQNFKPAKLAIAALPEDTDDDGIPGEASVDYPTFHTIPRTIFSCAEQEHNGYYADMDTSCQVVHLCQAGGVKSSFLCPNGTIFSQQKFSCQWWYKVNCEDSPKFYAINDNLYKTPEEKE